MYPIAILCGGLGTRLGALTEDKPKCLVEVAGRPFIAHQLALLRRHHFREVILCIGHYGDQIQDFVGDGAVFGLHVRYVPDGDTPLGTGGALYNAYTEQDDWLWYLYGDVYLEAPYELIKPVPWRIGRMMVARIPNVDGHGNVLYWNGEIGIYNKIGSPLLSHIDAGAGLLSIVAFSGFTAPFDLGDVFALRAGQGLFRGYEVPLPHDIGTPEALAETRAYLEGLKV